MKKFFLLLLSLGLIHLAGAAISKNVHLKASKKDQNVLKLKS